MTDQCPPSFIVAKGVLEALHGFRGQTSWSFPRTGCTVSASRGNLCNPIWSLSPTPRSSTGFPVMTPPDSSESLCVDEVEPFFLILVNSTHDPGFLCLFSLSLFLSLYISHSVFNLPFFFFSSFVSSLILLFVLLLVVTTRIRRVCLLVFLAQSIARGYIRAEYEF